LKKHSDRGTGSSHCPR